MTRLPVIVGIGGMNSAGRSSGFHSYKRMVCEALSDTELENTWNDLAHRMGIHHGGKLTEKDIQRIKEGTLVRRIDIFDPDNITCHNKARLDSSEQPASFILHKSKLPKPTPKEWHIVELENNEVKVTTTSPVNILLPDKISLETSSGGCLPAGFDPGKLYNSCHHPRGLKLAIYGASDALNSLGFEWEEVLEHIKPDEISVYAGSGFSQVDENSFVGLIAQPLLGNRITSRMLALSLAEMPADFINSYVINSVGTTGTNMGACATFLYNLRQGISDIQQNKSKVVIVGNAEAAIAPELMEGFIKMGALAKDDDLKALDHSEQVNNRRACRPFSTNTGFTVAESAQFVVLMHDELALKLGATIYGSVADIFISADANKKSITAPGIGNYITVAKTAALAKAILGQAGLQKTFVQAHGTGTPLNRTTESHILNEVAKTFSIKDWPIAAIKSYVGHSVSAAAGDQLLAALGVWKYGWIPGIRTIDHIAEDVYSSNLNILLDHYFVGEQGVDMEAAIINSKGFGGNNATGLILSPQKTLQMLSKKYGAQAIESYQKKNALVTSNSEQINTDACEGKERIIYKFGQSVMDEKSVALTSSSIKLSEFSQSIDLPTKNPYSDYE